MKPMEEHFNKILYLIIGLLYTIISHSKKHATEEEPVEERPAEALPPLTTVPRWRNTGEEAIQTAAAPTLHPQATAPSLLHATKLPSSTPAHTQPKIERTLSRYSGWKKALVMSELMRPYT